MHFLINFKSNGLTIIQNGVKSKSPWDDFKRPELANGGGALPAADKNVAFARPQPSSAVKVRSNFDETFLWRSVEVLGDCSNLNVIIPDSITKYKLIAVSVNKRFGLGMNDNDNFTVFLPFYI